MQKSSANGLRRRCLSLEFSVFLKVLESVGPSDFCVFGFCGAARWFRGSIAFAFGLNLALVKCQILHYAQVDSPLRSECELLFIMIK